MKIVKIRLKRFRIIEILFLGENHEACPDDPTDERIIC